MDPYLPYKIVEKFPGNETTFLPKLKHNEHFDHINNVMLELKAELLRKYDANEYVVNIKRYAQDCFDLYENQLEAHRRLKNIGLSPEVAEEGVFRKYKIHVGTDHNGADKWTDKFYIVYLVTKKCGTSLDLLYIPEELRNEYEGPGVAMTNFNENLFREFFPSEFFSQEIITRVRNILVKLRELGILHEDIHPGNFLEFEGKILAIDFEAIALI